MKKIFLVLLLLIFVVGTKVTADVVTTTRKINPEQNPAAQSQTTETGNKLVDSIRTCKPYSENMSADYLGMGVAYKIDIKGWVDNKCRLDFSAQTTGVSSSFSKLYGVDPEQAQIFSFVPKVSCAFTKEQLDYVGDSILQEKERDAGAVNNMLKDPNKLSLSALSNMSDSDAKLMDVIINQGACQILNTDELNKMLNDLFF